MPPDPSFRKDRLLKRDLMGTVEAGTWGPPGAEPLPAVRRRFAAAPLWARPIAWALARREVRALAALAGVPRVPALIRRESGGLVRSYIDGTQLDLVRPSDAAFYASARRLLRDVHRRGVTHNDTHKEANWLVTPDGSPALVDYQLASCHRRRGGWFRLCRLEDIRHLLKHKRTYCPGLLTARERGLLARKSWVARWWQKLVKPGYLFVTRRLFGWRDREGRGYREAGPDSGIPGGKTAP